MEIDSNRAEEIKRAVDCYGHKVVRILVDRVARLTKLHYAARIVIGNHPFALSVAERRALSVG